MCMFYFYRRIRCMEEKKLVIMNYPVWKFAFFCSFVSWNMFKGKNRRFGSISFIFSSIRISFASHNLKYSFSSINKNINIRNSILVFTIHLVITCCRCFIEIQLVAVLRPSYFPWILDFCNSKFISQVLKLSVCFFLCICSSCEMQLIL